MEKSRGSFTGSLGFVLAAAGSAVGLGNIWRFPYLAAKDGGGIFLLVYLILALTFGFTLLITEVSIGRKTKQSPLTAYQELKPGWGGMGIIACLIPIIIMPYYCAIGGWVLRYFVTYITGQGTAAAGDDYFTGFITQTTAPIIFMLIFMAAASIIVFLGVDRGIEICSRILMPLLLIMIIGISIYSLTIRYTDDSGATRTGLQGLAIYVIPDFTGMTLTKLLGVIRDALGQLFYSLSVAMGIMISYGSYMKDDVNLGKSINQIEIFDTIVAFLAGLMIIPAVYVFMGKDGMSAGPSLMFITLPKVFNEMGFISVFIGILFFLMVLFAAITSAVSIMEAIVSSFMDKFHISRNAACVLSSVISVVAGIIVCLGYNIFYFELQLPNGATAQVLDLMDYVSNNILMPIVSIGTCILVGWILGPRIIEDEVEKTGQKMGRKMLYRVMLKYIAPLLLLVLLIQAFGVFS